MSQRLSQSTILLVFVVLAGCSDPTLPHREKLAICIVKSSGPLKLDFDSIAPEMHRMHMGAERARRTARLLEEFLATSPQLDSELLHLVDDYAKVARKLEAQFNAALDQDRTDLTGDEIATAQNCAKTELMLQSEICERIDFDSLVTISP